MIKKYSGTLYTPGISVVVKLLWISSDVYTSPNTGINGGDITLGFPTNRRANTFIQYSNA